MWRQCPRDGCQRRCSAAVQAAGQRDVDFVGSRNTCRIPRRTRFRLHAEKTRKAASIRIEQAMELRVDGPQWLGAHMVSRIGIDLLAARNPAETCIRAKVRESSMRR